MIFLEFTHEAQRDFLERAKENSGLSWDTFAKTNHIKRSTIFAYLREQNRIPKTVACNLSSAYGIPIGKVREIEANFQPKSVRCPLMSGRYAEFLGALAGDGHLHKKPAEMSIVLNKTTEKKYATYLCKAFSRLFGQKPVLVMQRNTIKVRLYSKALVELLAVEHDFPIGKKKGRLHIPKTVSGKPLLAARFLRGLFDTDGTICRHRIASGAMIEFSSRDKSFLREVNCLLQTLGFRTSVGHKGVRIYDKSEIEEFFRIVGTSNPKHRKRYEIFKKTGKVPLISSMRW